MRLIRDAGLTATPLALALLLGISAAASAQVATLLTPDSSPSPAPDEALEDELEFADREGALLAFAQCMRDNDIDMDDPVIGEGGGRRIFGAGPGGPGDPGDTDRFSEEFQAAQQACGPILEAARPEVDPEAEVERLEDQLLLSACIRQRGYPDYPDPVIGSDGRLQRLGGASFQELGIDRRSEEFREVMTECRVETGLEQLGPGGGPGGFGLGRGGN